MNEQQSTEIKVLLQYLESFLPADETDTDVILKSSQDIQDDLSAMVEISLGDISKEMLSCNYKIVIDGDGSPKWRMIRN